MVHRVAAPIVVTNDSIKLTIKKVVSSMTFQGTSSKLPFLIQTFKTQLQKAFIVVVIEHYGRLEDEGFFRFEKRMKG